MKKNILKTLGLTIFLTSNVWAVDGIILVLEAPLLKAPDMSSTVLQVLRKGVKVYVPNEVARAEVFPEFIPTFDRAGNRAYIPSKYVKIITGLPNEKKQAINYEGHDPTDYRLEEPIPTTYPFPNNNFVRALFAFNLGTNANSAYAYNQTFNDQKYGSEIGARISWMRRVSYDKVNRFYFGVIGGIANSSNKISFTATDTSAKENRSVMKVGPWLTYDAYKGEKVQFNVGSGFTFNYHSSKISMSTPTASDERSFSGFSLSPMISTGFQVSNIIPHTDFVSGADVSFYLPYTLKASKAGTYEELWSENQISSSMKAQLSLYLGFQFKY